MIKSHIIVKRPKGMGKRMDKTQDTIELLRTYGQEHVIQLIEHLDKAKLSKEQKEEFDTLGEMAIRKGEYAVVTMAGGQGTRLRTQWTKGNLSIRRLWKRKILI